MRLVLCSLWLCLAACSGAPAQSPPVAPTDPPAIPPPRDPPATPVAACHTDADCVAVDRCGCACEPSIVPPPPIACSETCGGTPCAGQHAVCRDGQCVLDPLPQVTS